MKQANRPSRVEKGWERMLPILDKEFPQDKERKPFLWLWLFPLLLAAAVMSYIYLQDDKATIPTELVDSNSNAQVQKITSENSVSGTDNGEIKQDQETPEVTSLVQRENKLNSKTQASKKLNSSPSLQKKKVTSREQQQKNVVSRQATKSKRQTQTTSAAATFNSTETASIKETILPTVTESKWSAPSNNLGHNDKNISTSKNNIQLSVPSQIKNLKYYLVNQSEPLEISTSKFTLINQDDTQPIQAIKQTKKAVPFCTIAANTFYAPNLKLFGNEISMGFGIRMNKLSLGLIAGGGTYYRNLYSNVKHGNQLTSEDANPSNPNNEDHLSNNEREITSTTTTFNKFYLLTGISGTYKLSEKTNIDLQVGAERYFPNSNSSTVEADTPEGTAIGNNAIEDNPPTLKNWNLYQQAGFSYMILPRLALGASYRYKFSDFYSAENNRFSGNKIFLSLTYGL